MVTKSDYNRYKKSLIEDGMEPVKFSQYKKIHTDKFKNVSQLKRKQYIFGE
jgi:hypothetical protein